MSHPVATFTLLADAESPGVAIDRAGNVVAGGVDLQLDSSGDLVIDSDLHWTSGLGAVAQGCAIRLQMFRGEWIMDLDFGVPYLENARVTAEQAILGQQFNALKSRAAFHEALIATPGVLDVTSIQLAFTGSTRTMTVDWTVSTDLGEITGTLEA